MTKSEAIELQTKIEKELSTRLGESCEVSLTLSGGLKISLIESIESNDYIIFDHQYPLEEVSYVRWNWYFDALLEAIEVIKDYFKEHGEEIYKLIWSYEHRRELEE